MGNALGITAKYVGMIERGEKQVDDDSSLGLLFQIQENRKPDDSASATASKRETADGISSRFIKVIGWAHAGEAASYDELPESWQNEIPTECPDPKAFAVSLEGDSMEPKFSDSDLLVVQPTKEVHSGCFVVARFANDGVIFRRLEMKGSKITLVALNPRYQSSEHTAEEFSWIYPVWGRWTQLWRK